MGLRNWKGYHFFSGIKQKLENDEKTMNISCCYGFFARLLSMRRFFQVSVQGEWYERRNVNTADRWAHVICIKSWDFLHLLFPRSFFWSSAFFALFQETLIWCVRRFGLHAEIFCLVFFAISFDRRWIFLARRRLTCAFFSLSIFLVVLFNLFVLLALRYENVF